MLKYLIGIDVGTSALKTALFTLDGRAVAQADAPYPVHYPHPGWAEQHPDDWWRALCTAMKQMLGEAGVNPRDVAAIGVAGQSWSAVLIDSQGQALNRTPIWMDTRSRACCQDAVRTIGEDAIFSISGNPLQPTYTLPKLLWYQKHQPELMRCADKVLQSNGYIVYRLTGSVTQDKSQGYGFAFFDMQHGTWNLSLARAFGISPSLLPDIGDCHQMAGHVTAEAARQTGLCEGIPVVLGGLDAACGTLGAGVYQNGQTQEQGGQAGGMSICMDHMIADRRLILSRHVVPDLWLLQGGAVGGGGLLRWIRQEFCLHEENLARSSGASAYAEMDRAAAAIPPGSEGLVFLPYMAGERSPIWDPDAKGVLFGLDYAKTRAHVIRAGMEGAAFALRHNCETAANAGAAISSLHAMGGAANSKVWTQIKADITGHTIRVPSSDTATALGAALLAGVGVGAYAGFEEAVRQTVSIRRTHVPDPAVKSLYDKAYRTYRQLYDNTKNLMKEAAHESGGIT